MVLAFAAVVVTSGRQAAVPVGASGGTMGSMSGMDSGTLDMTMRDIEGRALRVADGRPGVVVFVDARTCGWCIQTVRAASRAAARARGQLVVVNADAAVTRSTITSFARKANSANARYVVDDRNGMLASMLSVRDVGAVVVYDATGRVVDRTRSAAGISRALASAVRKSPS